MVFLIAVSDARLAQGLAIALRQRQCRVEIVDEPGRVLEVTLDKHPDLVIIDRAHEHSLVEALFAERPSLRIAIVLANPRETPTHHRVRHDGGVVFNIAPPVDADELIAKAVTPDPDGFDAVVSREAHDKEYVLRVFELSGRSVTRTAVALKIARRTVQRLLAQWGVRADAD